MAQAPSPSGWVGTLTLLDSQAATIATDAWTQPPERSQLEQVDLSDLQVEIRCHRKRLGWDGLQWQTYLEDNFGASMTLELDNR
jgi:predicted NAD/FAD-dependent oxidoreductase